MADDKDLGKKVEFFFEKFSVIGPKGVNPVLLPSGNVQIYPLCDERPILQLQPKADPEVKMWVPSTGALVIHLAGESHGSKYHLNYEVYRNPTYRQKPSR
jgi:hypothetical protein